MKIFNYDEDGFFVCESRAEESPLEPGVFLIPRNATTSAPPAIAEDGKVARYVERTWQLVDAQSPESVEPLPELTNEEKLALWRQGAKISRFQARATLLQAGLLDEVEAHMALPDTDQFTKLAWSDAIEFRRQSPLVEAMKPILNLTDEQLDDLFRFAATIFA